MAMAPILRHRDIVYWIDSDTKLWKRFCIPIDFSQFVDEVACEASHAFAEAYVVYKLFEQDSECTPAQFEERLAGGWKLPEMLPRMYVVHHLGHAHLTMIYRQKQITAPPDMSFIDFVRNRLAGRALDASAPPPWVPQEIMDKYTRNKSKVSCHLPAPQQLQNGNDIPADLHKMRQFFLLPSTAMQHAATSPSGAACAVHRAPTPPPAIEAAPEPSQAHCYEHMQCSDASPFNAPSLDAAPSHGHVEDACDEQPRVARATTALTALAAQHEAAEPQHGDCRSAPSSKRTTVDSLYGWGPAEHPGDARVPARISATGAGAGPDFCFSDPRVLSRFRRATDTSLAGWVAEGPNEDDMGDTRDLMGLPPQFYDRQASRPFEFDRPAHATHDVPAVRAVEPVVLPAQHSACRGLGRRLRGLVRACIGVTAFAAGLAAVLVKMHRQPECGAARKVKRLVSAPVPRRTYVPYRDPSAYRIGSAYDSLPWVW
eukprot:jgi/Ulvmu1/338/UM001_0342.1